MEFCDGKRIDDMDNIKQNKIDVNIVILSLIYIFSGLASLGDNFPRTIFRILQNSTTNNNGNCFSWALPKKNSSNGSRIT